MPHFCSQCGASLSEKDQFCGKCGSRTQSASTQIMPGFRAPRTGEHAPASQEIDTAAQRHPQETPQNSLPSSRSRWNLPPLLTAIAWALFCAVGFDMWLTVGSFAQAIDRNILFNKWAPYDTPQHLHDNAMSAGGHGLIWGFVLGGIGGWIKGVKNSKMLHQ